MSEWTFNLEAMLTRIHLDLDYSQKNVFKLDF